MNDPNDLPPTPQDDPQREHPAPPGGHEVLWRIEKDEGDWDLPPRFELQRDLGDGQAGPMFLVRDLEREGRVVRLELVSSKHAPRAVDRDDVGVQLRAVASVDSTHVARALDVGRLSDGRVFALYEHVEGETLAKRLEREGALHPLHALEITRQILLAIEALHGPGLDHGGLTTRDVWLESHVAKTDDNPFGVSVQVFGAGLALPSDGRGLSRDMRAVGEILSLSLGAAHGSGALEDGARSLAHAMLADVERPLSHAESARRAVERLLARSAAGPATKGSSDPYGLKRGGVAAAVVALTLLGWIAWNLQTGAKAAARAADSERARFLNTQSEMLERVRRLRTELAEGESTLKTRLEEFEAALRAEGAVSSQAERGDPAARAELEVQRGVIARLTKELDAQRAELLATQTRLAEALAVAEDSVRAARGLDALLELLAAGEGARAAERARVLEAEGLMGLRTDFARALASASAQVERFEASRAASNRAPIDLAAADDAQRSLARANEQRAAFLDEAADWIGLALTDAPPTPRSERLERALEQLQQRVSSASAERDLAHQREWSELQATSALDGPERALAHSARFGCRHADELGERFVQAFLEVAVVGDSLDAEPLKSAPHLDSWLEHTRNGDVQLADGPARDLELLDAARRWYGRFGALDLRSQLAADDARPAIDRSGSWRDQLALQWRLASADAALALEVGHTAWRLDVDPSGAVEWWREVVESDAGGVRTIRRTRFSSDGETALGEGVLRVERNDGRVHFVGCRASLVELRASGAGVAVSVAPPPTERDLPAALARGSEQRVALPVDSERDLCLVYTEGDVQRWISPRFGIVREETRTPLGVAVTQLVAFQR